MSNRTKKRKNAGAVANAPHGFRTDGIAPGQFYQFGSAAPAYQVEMLVADYEPLPDGAYHVIVCNRALTIGFEGDAEHLAEAIEVARDCSEKIADALGQPVQTLHLLDGSATDFEYEVKHQGLVVD